MAKKKPIHAVKKVTTRRSDVRNIVFGMSGASRSITHGATKAAGKTGRKKKVKKED